MMSRPEEPGTSASLLAQLADSQDRIAWQRFFDRYHPLILGWCGRWKLAQPDREEVAAMVLAKLAEQMPLFRYDPRRGAFRGWLKTVVENAIRDLLRGWQRKPGMRGTGDSRVQEFLGQLEEPSSAESLAEELDTQMDQDRQLAKQAQALVRQRVAAPTWEAFWLTAIEGRRGSEAAARLGMKVTAVHMAKSRVARMLREEISRLQQEGGG